MEWKGINRSWLSIMLLEKCNFSCRHCAWIDGRIEYQPATHPGYKLSWAQIRTCLEDGRNIQGLRRIHFSGGEPTLWKDGDMDFVDLLIEVAHSGFEPSFITNGSSFLCYVDCQQFFERYLAASSRTLHISHSLDTFHGNFDPQRGRAESLDNLVEFRRSLPAERRSLLDVEVNACISKDPSSLLPEEMVEYYRSQGIEFSFKPLQALGKAKSISHLCPNLQSKRPEELGAYYQFHQARAQRKSDPSDHLWLWGNEYHVLGSTQVVAHLGDFHKSVTKEEETADKPIDGDGGMRKEESHDW
jgi:MoaA/NifB/PqqE/SkfB family radical SAM enzyme